MPRIPLPAAPSALFGVYSGTVLDVKDPQALGRIRVSLPSVPGSYEGWARLAVPMAGSDRGVWFVPDAGDEVVVAFEGGEASRPFVIGSVWNGLATPPVAMDAAGGNDLKVIRSRNGVTVTLDDRDGAERFQVDTPGGQRFVLKDGPGEVTLQDANGNSVRLAASGIRIEAAARVELVAGTVHVSSGMVQVDAGMTRCSGVLQCDTLIANSVIAASYTPGAGNVL